MAVELHLPDLPEVPIALGAAAPRAQRARQRWTLRLRDALSAYLPLLLMALLAAGSWWLVKNAPGVFQPKPEGAPRSEPDYTMSGFVLERFEPGGRLKARLEGEQMRHFPDTDRIEIERLKLRAIAPDGRITLATAQRSLSNGDGSEVQLFGNARVETVDKNGAPLVMTSEFLHLYTVSEKLRTHLPVLVQRGGTELRAGSLSYDHGQGRAEFGAPVRTVFPARGP